MPKTGGTFVKAVLRASIPAADFRVETEFETLGARSSRDFVIGSVRNPCEYYVSLYSYGLAGRGSLERDLLEQTGLHMHDLYTPGSRKHFRRWLTLMRVSSNASGDSGRGLSKAEPYSWWCGLESMRFTKSYIRGSAISRLPWSPVWNLHRQQNRISDAEFRHFEEGLTTFKRSSVDCWVKTESIVGDLRACLSRYQEATGKQVDWASFNRTLQDANRNPSTHRPCSWWYDNETEAIVRGADRHIFDLFGYTTCCVH